MKQRPGFYMSRRKGIVAAHLTMFKLEIVFNFVLRAAIVSCDKREYAFQHFSLNMLKYK